MARSSVALTAAALAAVATCAVVTVLWSASPTAMAMRLVFLAAVLGGAMFGLRALRREAAQRDRVVRELAEARRALEERKVVERAKGLLMKALGLAEPDAFRRLQLAARERNLRLVDVARAVVEQEGILQARADANSARS